MLPRCGEIQIGAGHPYPERIQREIGSVALKEIIDIRSPAQKDAAQDQGLHGFRMGYGVSQSERASPAAAKDVHLAVDMELTAEPQHVIDQMRGRRPCTRGEQGNADAPRHIDIRNSRSSQTREERG